MRPTAAKRISDPALLRADAIRARKGADIGEATQLFSVPDVVSAEGGRLVTTLVPGIVPLRQVLHEATRQEAIRIACWAERVLAAIHTRKEPAFGGSSVGWRGSFTRPDPVWVHGCQRLVKPGPVWTFALSGGVGERVEEGLGNSGLVVGGGFGG